MQIDRDILDDLSATYGDAFYLLDCRRFRDNFRRFHDAFARRYPSVRIAYSYKTNYVPRLCRIVQELGGYAEVVSGMEYDLARRIGVPSGGIVYNGPYKPRHDLERALLDGAVVNVDSISEVAAVASVAASAPPGRELRLGIRCNFVVPDEQPSRFGIDVTSPEFRSAIETLRSIPGCRVVGLHCHFCTPHKSARFYAAVTEHMLALADTVFRDEPAEFINVGGGFFSPMSAGLAGQFNVPVPTYEDYADEIAARFASRYSAGAGPELILEPGVALVADVMQFVTRVVHVKRVAGRELAVVNGSVYNTKPTKNRKNLPVRVIPGDGARPDAETTYDLVGYTCMEDDLLFEGFRGRLAAGDRLVIDNVGAYTVVLKPPFIFPAPPIVALDEAGNPELVKRAETSGDIFRTYP